MLASLGIGSARNYIYPLWKYRYKISDAVLIAGIISDTTLKSFAIDGCKAHYIFPGTFLELQNFQLN